MIDGEDECAQNTRRTPKGAQITFKYKKKTKLIDGHIKLNSAVTKIIDENNGTY